MAYPRLRARELRTEKKLSLDEIAERLALPKTTVWYWIKDLPALPQRSKNPHPGTVAMQAKYQALREAAYERGESEYDDLLKRPTFRDFVVLYVAEGYKRSRNRVSIGNSDPRVVAMAAGCFRSLTTSRLLYCIEHHADQDLEELRGFWGPVLGIDGSEIRFQRKSNSGKLVGRRWRSVHGVLTVVVDDTLLRARLQASIDRVRDDWGLDSADAFGA